MAVSGSTFIGGPGARRTSQRRTIAARLHQFAAGRECDGPGPYPHYLPAGQLRAEEMSIIGPAAVASFSQFYFEGRDDQTAGMTAGGVFASPEDSAMKHVFPAQSQRRILLADQSKFRRLSTVRVAGLEGL